MEELQIYLSFKALKELGDNEIADKKEAKRVVTENLLTLNEVLTFLITKP